MGQPQIQGGAPFDKASVCLSTIATPSNSLHDMCVAIQAIHYALAVSGVLYAGPREQKHDIPALFIPDRIIFKTRKLCSRNSRLQLGCVYDNLRRT